jgi:ribosomal protein S12 methylthiotransferase accessory factor YcaO
MTQEEKDRKDFDQDPLERLNKRRTKRLERAYFQQLREDEMLEEDKEILQTLGLNHY